MKRNIFITLILSFILSFFVYGEKADFKTAEKFAPENLRKLVGTRNVKPQWVPDSDNFIYEFKKNDITEYYFVDPVKRIKRKLLNREILSGKLSTLSGENADPDNLGLKKIRLDKNLRNFHFIHNKIKYKYNLKNKKLKSLGPATENIKTDKFGKRSPDGKWVIYSKGHNLYVKSTSTSNSIERQLTNNGKKWFSYSVNEKSKDGTKEESTIGEWFSDSKKIYCLRKD
ncbi:MAG: DPP IV N-terminal domain-containing protein, partial [Candidatus Aminicenantes bacterium]|nr:DPP IV N-terminal domain-containing protein [Candidatus Aminicenantes bacterium]